MPLLSLPDECFSNILSILDVVSLYKCLFVNRYWCKLSIPIIWREPFEYDVNRTKFSLTINTLLTYLNENEISSLIPCSINFNNQSPLFEYGKFIRKINHDNFVQNILTWVKSSYVEEHDVDQDCRVQKLVNVLYHMIIRQGSNLQELILYIFEDNFVDLPKFSIFTTFMPGITNLRSLDLCIELRNDMRTMRYQNAIKFLSMVPKLCNGIVTCKVDIIGSNSEFIKPFLDIIELQPLKEMSIFVNGPIGKVNEKKIIDALEFRSETLKKLSLNQIDFQGIDFSFMSKLEYLEHLEITLCKGFTLNHFETLSKKKFHLKKLDLHYNIITRSDIMINSLCSKSLLGLSMRNITLESVKAVKESCPSISFLHIGILSGQSLNLLIPVMCELSSLKILHIQINYNTGLLVEILGNYLRSVEYLYFNFFVDITSFEYFVNNCKVNLKRWIIKLDNDTPPRKNYLTHVNNYQKVHKSLQILGVKNIEDYWGFSWSNEELEIINLLKNQGVDVVSSSECNSMFYLFNL